ncbi:MAG: hypothetical protein RLZZ517_117 [Candidatus Parcubacteria bacterium]|jgi:peptide deformylase
MKEKNPATLLAISQLGNPILRKKAKEVLSIKDTKIQELIDSMIDTCLDAPGVGIAAPQVYDTHRIFIMVPCKGRDAKKLKPVAVINPQIISTSKQTKKDWEGYLSVPGIRALVPRRVQIKVEFFDRTGKRQTKTFKDFNARIFQHEYDHLEGVMFIDRTDSRDIITEKEYQKLMRKK